MPALGCSSTQGSSGSNDSNDSEDWFIASIVLIVLILLMCCAFCAMGIMANREYRGSNNRTAAERNKTAEFDMQHNDSHGTTTTTEQKRVERTSQI